MCASLLHLTPSQKMKNNYVYGLSNPALRQAQEGVVDLHLPAVDMTAVLKDVDREFVKQHPMMKKVLEEEGVKQPSVGEEARTKREREEAKEKRKRVRVSKEAFLDVNTPLKDEKEEVDISDEAIEANRLSEEEMMKLPPMRNVSVGGRVFP